MRLALHARRFRCAEPTGARSLFAERFPGRGAAGARRSTRLGARYRARGLVLGGAAGARLATERGLAVSPDTRRRVTTAAPLAAPPTPRVLGVEDWSWRKGRRGGTILVDLERRQTSDRLPDRQAGTFAAWRAAHPGVAVISRDRGGAYADGGRPGAPDAVPVADRVHLLTHAGAALARLMPRHHADWRAAASAVDPDVAARVAASATPTEVPASPAPAGAPVSPPTSVVPALPESQARRVQRANRARRAARYEAVGQRARPGRGPTASGRRVGLPRRTVARWRRADGYPERAAARPRRSSSAAYAPYLRERGQVGRQNARQLWREGPARGVTGGHAPVRRLVVRWRAEPGRPGPPRRRPPALPSPAPPPAPPPTRPWSPRQARWLLVRPADALRPAQRADLRHLGAPCPARLVGPRLATECPRLVRARDHAARGPWLPAAAESGLPECGAFATGLERDRAAVAAARTTAWSNGQTAARVPPLQAVRRQRRGRGGLALVRRRVVTAA